MRQWLLNEGYSIGILEDIDFWEFESEKKYEVVCSFGFLEHFIDFESVIKKSIHY